MSTVTTLATLRDQSTPQQALQNVSAGFFDLQSFELMQRVSKMFASSNIVPEAYRSVIEKLDRYGNVKETIENPRAMANCAVALSMAQRMNADPMMVMQNLHIIEGRPSWSSQWIIAAVNSCGRFSPLHFDIEDKGKCDIEYVETYWEERQRKTRTKKITVNNKICTAWATEKATGDRIESPPVSIEIAVKEGWYGRNGSKWQTMPDMMLRYRSAAFFGKLYAPEILMGLVTAEEAHDTIDATRQDDGSYSVTVSDLREPTPEPRKITSEPEPAWPQPNPDTGELIDIRGCPWIEGIHSDGKTCNTDGTWRRRKGVGVELAAAREIQAMDHPKPVETVETVTPDEPATNTGNGVTFDQIMKGIQTSETRDQIDEWYDLSRSMDLYPEGRETIDKAANTRVMELGIG